MDHRILGQAAGFWKPVGRWPSASKSSSRTLYLCKTISIKWYLILCLNSILLSIQEILILFRTEHTILCYRSKKCYKLKVSLYNASFSNQQIISPYDVNDVLDMAFWTNNNKYITKKSKTSTVLLILTLTFLVCTPWLSLDKYMLVSFFNVT